LNIICTGSGSPTVILDAGLGADASAWRAVQPAIAHHTRVCSYDRAGMGLSDPTTSSRDAAAMVSDLHALLRGVGISPPYVLVGWSLAGLYTRLYANRYPDDVTGLVEVDPSSENDDANGSKIVLGRALLLDRWRRQFHECAANVSKGTCAYFQGGLARYRKALRAAGCPHVDPQECALAEVRGDHQARASYWRDAASEIEAITRSSAELRASQRPYGNLPLIVLTDSQDGDIDHVPHAPSDTVQRAIWAAKNKEHERIAKLSSVGAHFVVAGSMHAIQIDHPSTVVSAVDEVVDQARSSGRNERSTKSAR